MEQKMENPESENKESSENMMREIKIEKVVLIYETKT